MFLQSRQLLNRYTRNRLTTVIESNVCSNREISCHGTRFVFFFLFIYILLSNRAMKREKFLPKRHTFDRNNIYHDVFYYLVFMKLSEYWYHNLFVSPLLFWKFNLSNEKLPGQNNKFLYIYIYSELFIMYIIIDEEFAIRILSLSRNEK